MWQETKLFCINAARCSSLEKLVTIRQDTFSKAYFRDSQKVKTLPYQGNDVGSNPTHGAISVLLLWSSGRVVYDGSLENCWGLIPLRGFKSYLLRQFEAIAAILYLIKNTIFTAMFIVKVCAGCSPQGGPLVRFSFCGATGRVNPANQNTYLICNGRNDLIHSLLQFANRSFYW